MPSLAESLPLHEHAEFAGRAGVPLTPENLARYDLTVLVTAHRAVDYARVAAHARLIVDTRNAFANLPVDAQKYFKA